MTVTRNAPADQAVVSGADSVIRSVTLRVLETSVYRGPHLYSHIPMIRIQADLGRLEQSPSDSLPGFADRLMSVLPGLVEHGCSYESRGGFERRLREGTWLGHVAEHVALELQTLAGSPVSRGKTRSVKGRPGVYNILYAYKDEALGRFAGAAALRLIESLLPEELRGFQGLDRLDRELAGAASAGWLRTPPRRRCGPMPHAEPEGRPAAAAIWSAPCCPPSPPRCGRSDW